VSWNGRFVNFGEENKSENWGGGGGGERGGDGRNRLQKDSLNVAALEVASPAQKEGENQRGGLMNWSTGF